MTAKEKTAKIVKVLDSKKADEIKVIGVTDLTILADYFVIAGATSTTHTKSLADELEFKLSQEGIEPSRTEGYNGASWIILDYSDVVVHVFYKEARDYYQLERLWADGEQVDISEFLDKS